MCLRNMWKNNWENGVGNHGKFDKADPELKIEYQYSQTHFDQ